MTAPREPVPALVALANATRPRRLAGADSQQADDPFSSAQAAQRLLELLVPNERVTDSDLPALRDLAHEVDRLASALADDTPLPEPEALNRLARQCLAAETIRLTPQGRLVRSTEWRPAPAAAQLARRVVEELGGLDPKRLRICARRECSLIFYDTTRSNTQRWHSEDPCGWRERQQRRRHHRPETT